MTAIQLKDEIQQYLTDNFLVDFRGAVTAETNLFEAGLIDSFGFVQLVGYIEQEYKLKVTDEDVTSDALTTLTKIVAYVEKKNHG